MATQTLIDRTKSKLVDELAKRVKAPEALDEPFVLQDRIPQTRTRHVVVIWDRWSEMDRAERSNVILDAYCKAGVLGKDSITVAMGLTQQEAMQMGYLPYSIVAMRKPSDPVTLERLKQAMESAGGVHVRTGSLLQLRFPSLDLAQEAYRQLIQGVPGPYWAIQHETTTSDTR
ncbi:MAG TPA: hypothetical protein VIL86_10120 [Tepidisphaeraceae bacterium]|jgi:hypothetical protein